MLFYLFLLFTVLPLVELALLIWIGGQTEWWLPIVLVLATGLLGAALARWQGWWAIARIRNDLSTGRMPADAMLDGLLILMAGVMLVTPGVLTDAAAVVLLVPPLRRLVKRGIKGWLKRHVKMRAARFTSSAADRANGRDEIVNAHVIDTRVEDAHL